MTTVSYADNTPRISIKLASTSQDPVHYLCVYNAGCFSMSAGKRGVTFPISSGDMANLKRIVITDVRTMRMVSQPIAPSCNVDVAPNKTMTVYGTLKGAGGETHIDDLHCVVS
jgi:hypothetical protein